MAHFFNHFRSQESQKPENGQFQKNINKWAIFLGPAEYLTLDQILERKLFQKLFHFCGQ